MRRTAGPGAIGIALLLAIAVPARAAETWHLYIHQAAPQFATSRGAARFASEIDAGTHGHVHVMRHLAGTLEISSANITQAVADNIVQLGDDFTFTGNIPIGAVVRLPALLRNYDEFAKGMEIIRPDIEQAYARRGVIVLAGYIYPLQYFWSRSPITSLADLRGRKFRATTPEQGEFIRRFGGNSVALAPSEVPSALERGVVDGVVTAAIGAKLWQDLISTGFLMGTSYVNVYLIVNADAFHKLSPEDQTAVRQAAQDTARWNTQEMAQEEAADTREFAATGRIRLSQPSSADVAEAARRMSTYWDQWAKAHGPEAVAELAKIRALVKR